MFAPVVAVSFVVLFNPDSSKLSIAKVKINRLILKGTRPVLNSSQKLVASIPKPEEAVKSADLTG